MDMESASEADVNEQNPQNPTTKSSSSLSPLPELVTSSSESRNDPRTLHPAGFMGKHRMAAAISYLDQQIQIIQEELNQLDTLGESSTVCRELITSIESVADALLPETKGPLEIGWDRWFQGGHGSKNRKRWI